MSRRGIGVLLRHELRLLVRDRRMLVITFGVPVIVVPLLVVLLRGVEERDRASLAARPATLRVERDVPPGLRDLVRRAAEGVAEPAREGADGPADVVVRTEGADPPTLVLEYRADDDPSAVTARRLREALEVLRDQLRDSALLAAGLPAPASRLAELESVDVATPERLSGAVLGLVLTPLVLVLLLSGGSIAAVDTLAGERERGTLETLLTTAADRRDIVRAKQLAILISGLALVLVNAASLAAWVVLGAVRPPGNLVFALGFGDVLLMALLLAPLAALTASALLLLSGRSSSYRDYQVAFFPLVLLFLAPCVAAMLPDMELRSAVALAPVAGIGVAVRELAAGERDVPFLALAFLSTALPALWLSRRTEQVLTPDRLVPGGRVEAGPLSTGPRAAFSRVVLRWFAVLWAAFVVVSLWLGDTLGLRAQALLNVGLLLGGGSFLMIRVHRLPWREVLRLRRPRAAAWAAVLVGAPAGWVTGVGLATLVDAWLFPVPEGVLEAFGEVVTGSGAPLWQLVLLLAVLPGIVEEIAFRGLLLEGLSHRLRPLPLCLAVGAVFGLFHVSLFRIVPTAYLGVLLAGSVVLSRSLLPAIAWHTLHNALAVVPAHLGWVDAETRLPGWAYAVAAAALVASFGLMARAGRAT